MKNVTVKFEERAQEDLDCIYDYISKDSIYYANKTVNEIINKTEYLLMFPYMGRKIPEYNNINLREIIYKSYRIFYYEGKFDRTFWNNKKNFR